ncbi:hypothetical protein J1605_010060 [Eschrichtius robustus]|uniref:Uncharacterized protein n=1 Tax=Eschrichtius robustus TaxID=9764 RepID=A0AB34GST4_ESCRO|nr:hypothetical protein J1605_010060 [Eschrichtius robustus]
MYGEPPGKLAALGGVRLGLAPSVQAEPARPAAPQPGPITGSRESLRCFALTCFSPEHCSHGPECGCARVVNAADRDPGQGRGPACVTACPAPPPPGRPNSTPREGGADKGSGAARSAPDRLRHHALGPDVVPSDCPLSLAASATPPRVSGQRSRVEPAEGAPALLTHRSPQRRARAQPGTPRHVTARAGASREAGPARGTGVGREVAPAREGLSGTGHVTGVQAPPAAPPLAGASRLTGGGRPGPTLPRAPQPGLGHEARGLRPASARGGFPDRRWGEGPGFLLPRRGATALPHGAPP